MEAENNKNLNIDETGCLIQDGSIFIGLSSLSLAKQDIVSNTVEKILKEYKGSLKRKTKDYTTCSKSNKFLKEQNEYFYNPNKYYLFGEFDFAVITLIDGFTFPVREYSQKGFHLNTNDSILEFSRNNILGPTPKFNEENITKLYSGVFSQKSKQPLISISRLKLNDFFLLEKGTDFIRACIKLLNSKIKKEIESNLNFFIIENYSWSEITIVFLMNSYQMVSNLMLRIRSLVWDNLIASMEQMDIPLMKILLEKNPILIRENKDFHLFIDSHSIYGFDYELFNEINNGKLSLYEKILDSDLVKHNVKLSIKPGFVKRTLKSIHKIDKAIAETSKNESEVNESCQDKIFKNVVVKSDLFHQVNGQESISTKDLISWIVNLRLRKEEFHFIINTNTEVIIEHPKNPELIEIEEKLESQLLDSELNKLIFNSDTLNCLNDYMGSINVPHVIKEAVLNLFSIFNNKISDRLSFAGFIELRPFLRYLLRIIRYSKIQLDKENLYEIDVLLKSLDPGIHAFHHAYYNRVLGQYKNGNQYDQPMFFNLGSQSLISAFDILYKNITTVIGNKTSFVYVESDQNFTISDFALRLNYFHIFNPELLCAVLFQESMNQCSSRFKHEYPSLFQYNRKYDHDLSSERIYGELQYNGLRFSEYLNQYEEVLNAFTPEYFEHIFSDIVGYKLFYHNNPEMYVYWSWGYFCTDSKHFINKDGCLEVQDKYLIPFLLRQLMVLKCFDSDFYHSNDFNFDPKIDNRISENLELVRGFVENFFYKKNLMNWINEIRKFASEKYEEVFSNLIPFDQNDMMRRLIEGRVITYETNNNRNEIFQFTRNLLFSYLKAVRKITGETSLINIVDRNIESGNNSKNAIKYSNMLFDPHGGVYITNPEIRRKIYRLRSTFHMSIIDMSLKIKGKLLAEMINEKKDQIMDIAI
ncbi:MAG: hypothetical protein Mars2KO_44260 [Maribacter sp.]